MTAFVARSFRQAQPYITIEDSVIGDALNFLSVNQAINGSFPEVGKVSHVDMQGGSSKGIPLTAYVLLAFLENKVFLSGVKAIPRIEFQLKIGFMLGTVSLLGCHQ